MEKLRYMLDTNILSDLIKNRSGKAALRYFAVGEQTVCTSVIVACELRYGSHKSASAILTQRVDGLLERIVVLPLKPDVDHHYAAIRAQLESIGLPIGHNDYFIAAHARALELTLVTANFREFSRVPGLRVENWLAPSP